MDVARLTTYVNPSWCHISGLSFQEALGMVNNAVHDDKAAIINGWQMKPPLIKQCQNIVSCALKIAGSWDSLP
jgi:PAS domain-containing protein